MGEELSPPKPLAEAAGCDLDAFACGGQELDDWLKRRARPSEGRHARTYVVTAGTRVVAYYCLSAGSAPLADLPSAKFRRNAPDPVPVVVLGRMAVDQEFQSQGLGGDLMVHCLRQCLVAASGIGVRALLVHPLNERAGSFYRSLGLLPMAGTSPAMFLPIEVVERASASEG